MKRILSVILVVVMAFSLVGCSSSDYKAAVKSMEAGEYAAAAESFRALGEYEDSAALAQKCEYLLAVEIFEAGEYAGAVAAFEALGAYEDSADYLAKAKDSLLAEKLVGSWTCSMALEDLVAALAGTDMELPPLEMVVEMVIDADLSCLLQVDEAATSTSIQGFIDGFGKVMLDMVYAELAAYNVSMEDLFASVGVSTEEELIEMLITESGLTVEALMADMPEPSEGQVTVENGVIQLLESEAETTLTYDAETDVITMTEGMGFEGLDINVTGEFTRK